MKCSIMQKYSFSGVFRIEKGKTFFKSKMVNIVPIFSWKHLLFVVIVNILTLCPQRNFSCFLICCLLIFFKIKFFKNFFQEYHLIVEQTVDPDQARCFVRPDLNPNSNALAYATRRLIG